MKRSYFVSYHYSHNGGGFGFGSASIVRNEPLCTAGDMQRLRVELRDTQASKGAGVTGLVIIGVFKLEAASAAEVTG